MTPQRRKELEDKYGVQSVARPQVNTALIERIKAAKLEAENKPSAYEEKFAQPLGAFSLGAVKGGLSTAKNILELAQTGGQKMLAGITPGKTYEDIRKETGFETLKPETEAGKKAKEFVTPEGTAEKIGFGAEQIAEYFVPAAKAAKAEKFVSLLSQGIKSPLLGATARILGKAGVQAGAAGAVGLAQTGDIKEAGKIAATAGIIRGGMATIGEGARAMKLPERLYNVIFKNAKTEMMDELKAGGFETMEKNHPKEFQEFIDKGIIKITPGQDPTFNETLAEQALHRGLSGSLKNMSDEVVYGALKSEDEARAVAQTYKNPISLQEKQYENVLRNIADDYKDVGFGEVSDEATKLADILKTKVGQVSADEALSIRRFFDRMRIASSFDKPISKLSQTQANFKTLADSVRQKVNEIPGMGKVMKNYSFYLDALENLASEATKRGNAQVISLIDSIFLGGGLASTHPIPVLTMGVLRRIIQSPKMMTALGQLLSKSNATAKTIGAISVSSGAIGSEEDQ